jgi:hypothetical protein
MNGIATSMSRRIIAAVLVALLGGAGLAWAGTHVVVTPAGCNVEFKGAAGACLACVKSKGKFRKDHKGNWSCQR